MALQLTSDVSHKPGEFVKGWNARPFQNLRIISSSYRIYNLLNAISSKHKNMLT